MGEIGYRQPLPLRQLGEEKLLLAVRLQIVQQPPHPLVPDLLPSGAGAVLPRDIARQAVEQPVELGHTPEGKAVLPLPVGPGQVQRPAPDGLHLLLREALPPGSEGKIQPLRRTGVPAQAGLHLNREKEGALPHRPDFMGQAGAQERKIVRFQRQRLPLGLDLRPALQQ